MLSEKGDLIQKVSIGSSMDCREGKRWGMGAMCRMVLQRAVVFTSSAWGKQ